MERVVTKHFGRPSQELSSSLQNKNSSNTASAGWNRKETRNCFCFGECRLFFYMQALAMFRDEFFYMRRDRDLAVFDADQNRVAGDNFFGDDVLR